MERWIDNGEVVSTIKYQQVKSYKASTNTNRIDIAVGVVDNHSYTSRQLRSKGSGVKKTHTIKFIDFSRLSEEAVHTLLTTWDHSIPLTIHAGRVGIDLGTALMVINYDSVVSGVGTMFYFDMVGNPTIKKRRVKRNQNEK